MFSCSLEMTYTRCTRLAIAFNSHTRTWLPGPPWLVTVELSQSLTVNSRHDALHTGTWPKLTMTSLEDNGTSAWTRVFLRKIWSCVQSGYSGDGFQVGASRAGHLDNGSWHESEGSKPSTVWLESSKDHEQKALWTLALLHA